MEYIQSKKVKTSERRTTRILAAAMAFIVAISLQGCGSSATVTSIEGTGNESPGGTLGTVMIIKNNLEAGNIGIRVNMYVKNFGNLQGVDNDDAQQVTAELVKGAGILNPERDYTEEKYYHYYNTDAFVKGRSCKISLFYFVKPDMIDENLVFNYDYNTGNKHIEVKKHITREMITKSFTEGEVSTGNTTIKIN